MLTRMAWNESSRVSFFNICLAKVIMFVKIILANCTTLNMLAADPYPKFSQEPTHPPIREKY